MFVSGGHRMARRAEKKRNNDSTWEVEVRGGTVADTT